MRFVIKVGTGLLTNEDHQLNVAFLKRFIGDLAAMHADGHEIVIVSSGAVAAGRTSITFNHEDSSIPYRQTLAAVGQVMLMKTYDRYFEKHNVVVAQALLTNYDFVNKENSKNTRNVFELLLKKNVIPIVNENDVTTIAELQFGDNDMLSAKTAALINADFLIIVTSVDGLFTADPRKHPEAKFIPVVERIDAKIKKLAQGAGDKNSRGGMKTKLQAAEYVTEHGTPMFIVNGTNKSILKNIFKFCKQYSDEWKEALPDLPVGCTFFTE